LKKRLSGVAGLKYIRLYGKYQVNKNPAIETLIKIAKALEVELDGLIK
jgi:DNA-binding phage protein